MYSPKHLGHNPIIPHTNTLTEYKFLTGKKKQPTPRALMRRKEEQDAIRAKFKGIEYARQLDECYKQYDTIHKDLLAAKTRKAKLTKAEREKLLQVRTQIEILNAQRDIVKAKIDLNLRRLKFVLPELKSIELSDPDGSIGGGFADAFKSLMTGQGDD